MDELVTWLRAQLDWQQDIAERAHTADVAADRLFQGHCSPIWTLREVESKRAILDLYEREAAHRSEHAEGESRTWLMEEVVQALALPYVDRPGYQESWRP